MRFVVLLSLAALALPLRAADGPSLPELYAAVYLKINASEQAERHGDFAGAEAGFKECYVKLAEIRASDRYWETALVLHRLQDCKAKIIELQPKADAAAAKVNAVPAGATNPAQAQEVLPADVEDFFASHPVATTMATWSNHMIYPWKTDVSSELIWIGEGDVKSSAWDANWVKDFNGTDTPEERNGYSPAGHACGSNPFYVALPFNDLAHPDLAQQWLPRGWARSTRDGKPISACKDRWVQLKNARGDVCYAQWEDAGPKGDDRASYVFGGDGVGKDEPGIGISPAVRDYLSLGEALRLVSWRFVDEADVRPGAWLKLDEQAVMFTAMQGTSAK